MNSQPSQSFLDFIQSFPNNTCVKMWTNNLKLGIDELGNFGDALYCGKVQEAFDLADSQNKNCMKQILFVGLKGGSVA